MSAAGLASGKGHRDENFPVASVLIRPRHRAVILAFYRFARAADDVADHATASAAEKLHLLDRMAASLSGDSDAAPEAAALRHALQARDLSPEHGLDLLEAFRRDVTKLRYRDWADLMDYCRYSAMPVGRFVLDVHGESRGLWPQSDALCAALQVINHLQDCAKDYRALNRVYIPADALTAAGIGVEALKAQAASPALLSAIRGLARRTDALLREAAPFASGIGDLRLGMEVAVIQRLAISLNRRLKTRDPLKDRVHHAKFEALPLALRAAAGFFAARLLSRNVRPQRAAPRR